MSRQSGKNSKVSLSTTIVNVTSESLVNAGAVTIGGIAYSAFQVWTFANRFMVMDQADYPVTLTLGVGTGSALPTDYDYVIDYITGRIIFNQALTNGNTVVASYSYASGFVNVGDASEWSFDEKVDKLDVTAFNDEWKQSVPLQKSVAGSLTGMLNIAIFNAFSAANGATDNAQVTVKAKFVYIKLYANRNTVGASNPYYVAQVLLDFSLKVPMAGKVEYTAKFEATGAIAQLTS